MLLNVSRWKLRSKILLHVAVVGTLAAVILTFLFLATQRNIIHTLNKEKAALVASMVENSIQDWMSQGKPGEVRTALSRISGAEDIQKIRILSPEGKILSSSAGEEIGAAADPFSLENIRKIVSQAQESQVVQQRKKTAILGYRLIPNRSECFRCHPSSQKVIGVLEVNIDYSRTASLLRRSQLLGILIAAISLALLAWIIIRLFEKLINRPIMLLKDRMAQVRQGKLDLSFPAVKQDEIGTLTQHFHHMVESLKKANHKIEELHRKEIERAEHLAAFGEMAAGLAHEIKNPLAGIRGALEVIHQRTNGKDPKKEIFQEMLYQIDKIKHILEDLLSYARPKEPKFRLIHPNICVEDALKLAKTQVGNKDIRFDFKGLDNGAQARIDPDRIQELMLNLIMNSISAIEKKGTIRIRLDSDNRDGLLITISDDGKGIEKKHLPKIFQPFFTTKPKGTGLGLSICKKIVESHNGSITVRSEPGKGTTFFIYLPVLERSINHEAEKNPRRG